MYTCGIGGVKQLLLLSRGAHVLGIRFQTSDLESQSQVFINEMWNTWNKDLLI